MKVSRSFNPYSFDEVLIDFQRMYIFEDNPLRTSRIDYYYGIPETSWYKTKYDQDGYGLFREPDYHGTTSCIRGLPNAYPLCTVKNIRGDFWEDTDLEAFSEYLESDMYNIIEMAPRFIEVILPERGIFGTNESKITEDRCPKIYWYLRKQMDYLWGILKMV